MSIEDITYLWLMWKWVLPGIAGLVLIGLIILARILTAAGRETVNVGWNIFMLLDDVVARFKWRWFRPTHWADIEKWEAERKARK